VDLVDPVGDPCGWKSPDSGEGSISSDHWKDFQGVDLSLPTGEEPLRRNLACFPPLSISQLRAGMARRRLGSTVARCARALTRRSCSLLKNAIVALFNPRQARSKLLAARKNHDFASRFCNRILAIAQPADFIQRAASRRASSSVAAAPMNRGTTNHAPPLFQGSHFPHNGALYFCSWE